MKLEQLLKGIEHNVENLEPEILSAEITDVTSDSRKAGPGTLFIALAGEKADGHDFAGAAAALGCTAVVAEHETGAKLPHILVDDSHEAYALICGNFFSNPSDKLKLIGVTGTNGKTTTAFIIKHILEYTGRKVGLIGTMQNMSGEKILPAHFTTPEAYELQKLFRTMADDACEYVVMEVSSHALAQSRVGGCHFEAGVFTNLTQDHLDFHKTMENYLKAKQKLFCMSDIGIFNLDDPYSDRFVAEAPCKKFSYSALNMNADYTARNVRYRNDGIDYELVGTGVIGRVSAVLPGSFSLYNTLAASACALSLGLPLIRVLDALKTFKGVKGRIEVVPTGRDFSVIIDYAHTPDALEKILKAVKDFAKGRVIALFGCGGDRDRTKRPLMGKIAAEYADYLVITSDNPRSEDPDAIIQDILAGLEGCRTPYTAILSRIEAIEFALKNAKKDDIILLAGKGHEDYQILSTGKIHLDEREVVADVLARM